MDELEKIFDQIRELVKQSNEDEIVLNVYHSLLMFFRNKLDKEIEVHGKTTDYIQGIIATLDEMERLYPCIRKWRETSE